MRTVYATALELRGRGDMTAALEYIGRWIEDWYRRRRLAIEVTSILVEGESVSTPAPGHELSIRRYSSQGTPDTLLTDLRWAHPDQYDKSLGWVTSLALLSKNESLLISLEVAVTGLKPVIAPARISLGSPRVIRDIARLRSVKLGGHPYGVAPELLGAEDVEALASELSDPTRPYPIVLVSRRVGDDVPLVDATELADRLAGAAKVYELQDKWAGFRLTEEMGRPTSCYGGAIRLYWPGFSVDADPFLHPLWMPWQFKDAESSERSLLQLCNIVFDAAAFRHLEPAAISSARLNAQREAREAARSGHSKSEDQLLEDLIVMEQKLEALEATHAEVLQENRMLRENAAALSAHMDWKVSVTPLPEATESQAEIGPPGSAAEAVQRAAAGARRLHFLASAYASAEDSPYKQPERVQQALAALEEVAEIWVGTLDGKPGSSVRELFKQRGFDYSDDVSQTSKGKWGSEYQIIHDGQKIDISPHITLGAKQADTCLSIHWAWDKASKMALVAHVGRHKTNTKT